MERLRFKGRQGATQAAAAGTLSGPNLTHKGLIMTHTHTHVQTLHNANEPRRFGRDSSRALSYAKIFTIPSWRMKRKIIRYGEKIIIFRFAGCIFRLSGVCWGFVTVYHLSLPPLPASSSSN